MKKNALPLAFAFLLGYFVSDLVDAPVVEDAQADSGTVGKIVACLNSASIQGFVDEGFVDLSLTTYCNY